MPTTIEQNDDMVHVMLSLPVGIDPITSPFEGRFTNHTDTVDISLVFAAFKPMCLGSRESTSLRRVPRVESFRPENLVRDAEVNEQS